MRFGQPVALSLDEEDQGFHAFLKRMAGRIAGAMLAAGIVFAIASLGTWNVADPSFSHATANPVTNAMGYAGAVFSDLTMQFFGLSIVAVLLPAAFWASFLIGGRGVDRIARRAPAWLVGALLVSGIVGCIAAPQTWPLPTGLGGVFGDLVLSLPSYFLGNYPTGLIAALIAVVLAVPTGWLYYIACRPPLRLARQAAQSAGQEAEEEFDEDEDFDEGSAVLGAITHVWLSAQAFMRRRAGTVEALRRRAVAEPDDGLDLMPEPRGANRSPRIEPGFDAPAPIPGVTLDDDFAAAGYDDEDDFDPLPPQRQMQTGRPAVQPAARVEAPAPRPVPGARVRREAQSSLIQGDEFEMPTLHFLAEPKVQARDATLSSDALEQNARLLEGVLEDFGVKGEIIHVRPGPVVTLYELEPAPGIKSSRVIGLADDIARSMSAIAARVAVVPGRNAIGIELPNARRETVYLREILASKDFEQTKAKLALALGKTINGEAVIADIAKMPHVLVAGTTGSGKSVAINTMILSLLYRMTPEQCRLIMIDPKMLELSVYDGVPHLLTPVVTDPKKAVVALKWTVREMEDRYRKMSKVGVRNIDGFNQRVAAAEKKGEKLSRTVQTGFDRETGEAIYETEDFDLQAMPYIVIIIDEMADLMMVAGKDIEGAVQRLAQMARAAGIHVIMATQRPSVDVITGTIKANFPTRISFQVTSKIDSRTILGEQGAEQLLGMGDMLYMAGGGRIQRVHGPFVSDEEVEKVVNHLKMQGVPEYLDSITEDEDGDEGEPAAKGGGGSGGGNFDDSDDPYDQAVAVVLRDGKASTSYIQRRLGIGYNRAASIIERMEKEGIVGAANHAGKREILVPTEEETY
jgi:S-DNA-T family DNA segregation ATPase FtsK/SpoIIIE